MPIHSPNPIPPTADTTQLYADLRTVLATDPGRRVYAAMVRTCGVFLADAGRDAAGHGADGAAVHATAFAAGRRYPGVLYLAWARGASASLFLSLMQEVMHVETEAQCAPPLCQYPGDSHGYGDDGASRYA